MKRHVVHVVVHSLQAINSYVYISIEPFIVTFVTWLLLRGLEVARMGQQSVHASNHAVYPPLPTFSLHMQLRGQMRPCSARARSKGSVHRRLSLWQLTDHQAAGQWCSGVVRDGCTLVQ